MLSAGYRLTKLHVVCGGEASAIPRRSEASATALRTVRRIGMRLYETPIPSSAMTFFMSDQTSFFAVGVRSR